MSSFVHHNLKPRRLAPALVASAMPLTTCKQDTAPSGLQRHEVPQTDAGSLALPITADRHVNLDVRRPSVVVSNQVPRLATATDLLIDVDTNPIGSPISVSLMPTCCSQYWYAFLKIAFLLVGAVAVGLFFKSGNVMVALITMAILIVALIYMPVRALSRPAPDRIQEPDATGVVATTHARSTIAAGSTTDAAMAASVSPAIQVEPRDVLPLTGDATVHEKRHRRSRRGRRPSAPPADFDCLPPAYDQISIAHHQSTMKLPTYEESHAHVLVE